MKHLKIAKWVELAQSPVVGEVEKLPAAVKAKELRDVAEAFAKNCQRLFRLTPLLTNLFEAGKRVQHVIALRQYESALRESRSAAGHVYVYGPGSRPPLPLATASGLPFEATTVVGAYMPLDATGVQSALEGLGDSAATDAVELLISMQIVGAWSAYEILATDVWLAAVNARPGSLGVSAWTARKSDKGEAADEDEGKETERQTAKAVSLDAIRTIGFDLAHRFGEIARREFGFNALDGIQKAYRAAFRVVSKNKSGVPDAVNKWFEGSDFADLRVLEALRHATVHRGGLADEMFKDRVKDHPVFGKLPTNATIPVDGEMARAYFTSRLSAMKAQAR